ncbi:MAG: radical SAM protein [Clostridia bacterium]|nr:radical SAM protein [Clostridia bacterium]
MPRILTRYRNGNYVVTLYADGTKAKETMGDAFIASFPDSIDLKITDYCVNNCSMCHERSSAAGRHGVLSHPIIDTFHSGMEVAIGGGNPLSHPDLLPFLKRLKERRVIPNITVNVIDLKKDTALIEELIRARLVYGVGVSCHAFDEFAVDFALAHTNVVLHVINGVFPVEDYRKLAGKGLKVLILGYKEFGRGREYLSSAVRERMRETREHLSEILPAFKVVSFDNLALTQLAVKEVIGTERFDEMYMGADGEASMYVDLVREEYALSSASEERMPLENTLEACFQALRGTARR